MSTAALNAVTSAGNLDRRVAIEAKSVTRDPVYGSESVSWSTLATVWAQVLEYAADNEALTGSATSTGSAHTYRRPVRVRMRWRSDVDTAMRLRVGTRLLQITGTAELGRRQGLELACQEWSHE